jgi:spore maturation protein CgeB
MIDLSFLPEDFKKKILDKVPANSYENLAFDTKSEIAILIYQNRIDIIGCRVCLMNNIEQDYLGNFKIAGKDLINGKDKKELMDLPEEIKNNIWLCPNCLKPFKDKMIKL